MRFIHTADWQIGMKRYFLDDDGQARFSEARENAIRRIAQVAREHQADFVVVAGDVFETSLLRPRTIRRALDAMREISVPVYLLPGNHDPLGPSSIYHSAEFLRGKPDHVFVIESEDPIVVDEEVEIVGVPWMAKRQVEDRVSICANHLGATGGRTRIMVGHGSVSQMGTTEILGVIDIVSVEQAMSAGKVHYLALGDRHSTTNCGNSGRIWYSGAPEPTDYDELDSGNVLVVDLSPTTIDVTPIATGTWRFVEKMLDVDAGTAEETLKHFLEGLEDKTHTIVKVNFRGTISILDQIALERLIEEGREVYAAIERHEHRDELAILPASGDMNDVNLSGFAREAFDLLIETSSKPDPEGQRHRDALALYYRLMREV